METGDPLLAVSRFGLGMGMAYTSDLTEKWGGEWLAWDGCGKFWAQAFRGAVRKSDAEGLVALLITSIVAVGLLTAYQEMTNVHRRGELAAESQRDVRTSFDTMLKELRYVGFDYDRDGDDTAYPNQPDQQTEFAGVAATTRCMRPTCSWRRCARRSRPTPLARSSA